MTASRTLRIGLGAVALGAAAALGLPAGATAAPAAPAALHAAARPAAQDVSATAYISRRTVIVRAYTWHPHTANRVPYSQNKPYHNGYRRDCSGYVSMALGLSKPGPNTQALATSRYTKPIRMSQLLKGDLVIDASGTSNTRHVVIFEKWVRNKKGKIVGYWAFEQRGHYGTDHRVLKYGLSAGSQYHAYHPKKVR
ncbi:C40 family peptidase [Actinoallomurus purpureus]|uniref:C40 family peptidase n=1 Tax=Actinoallomurus purpureus TaxID=478114 RepID=UPI002091FFE1|nr:C40 family peptidase [Actinoallomurus purpureus]MCO6008689.1 C40 family peptidase [Actinoallomurus purpureus]